MRYQGSTRHLLFAATLLGVGATSGLAEAQNARYRFTAIADSGGPFRSMQVTDINDDGMVLFLARFDAGGQVLFVGDGTTQTIVADTTGAFPDFAASSLNNHDTVAFVVRDRADGAPVAIYAAGPTLPLVRVVEAAPPFATVETPHIDDTGMVTFFAELTGGGQGIYKRHVSGGAIVPVAETGGLFADLRGGQHANASGAVVFPANRQTQVHLADAAGTRLVLDASGPFFSFAPPALSDAGTFAFQGFLGAGGSGIFASDGVNPPRTVVLDWVASGNATAFDLSSFPAVNSNGEIAFGAGFRFGDHRPGIFTGADPVADKVVQVGDSVFGRTLAAVEFFRSLNNAGQIAFTGIDAGGFFQVLRADPVRADVGIDIKPGTFPKRINLWSAGVIPVAILGDPSFDATAVDPATVTLSGAAVDLIGKGDKYACRIDDVNGDGRMDILCHVVTAQALLDPGDTVAVLEGQTVGGTPFIGRDLIEIVP